MRGKNNTIQIKNKTKHTHSRTKEIKDMNEGLVIEIYLLILSTFVSNERHNKTPCFLPSFGQSLCSISIQIGQRILACRIIHKSPSIIQLYIECSKVVWRNQYFQCQIVLSRSQKTNSARIQLSDFSLANAKSINVNSKRVVGQSS